MYASFLGFCASYIRTFLNSLFKIEFFNKLLGRTGNRGRLKKTAGPYRDACRRKRTHVSYINR
jgi:hypothetical protein